MLSGETETFLGPSRTGFAIKKNRWALRQEFLIVDGLVVFTVIARNYLAHARVLMNSVARHAPDALRLVILVDSSDGHFDPEEESFETISSATLPIPQSRWFHFKYSVLSRVPILRERRR